ncbi:hypothetical protein DL764_001234 [Monosporascus ibericus]|uniref:GPI inositol-deacylase winged helix domain-containing protein n=1 Tax=Monosporascus ibericus TaxID=155417 RepID=A0A4V1XCF3_9PEZI|nr:hypothetical protein DL764_001234 [Monosporascus ibericus]
MATEPRTHNDYTVGWVCALPKERTAAIAMLDQRHADLSKPPNDHNTYALGSIGNYNIVIACLPKGKIGTTPAATVAIQMINTFPSIKFGLMVGIGRGIPPKVRLGDVVVSVPVDEYPGVVQWDLGKAEQDDKFKRTGALNNPPTLLLTALANLESEHEMRGPKIPRYLDELKEKWPRLVPKYLRSDSMKDVLFKAEYHHVSENCTGEHITPDYSDGDGDEEEECCKYCDKTQVVKRKPRDMRVHYGLIASGNSVIKKSTLRDTLRRDLGGAVLCVEMEAAGLMDNFPCIVIRGICDYADSHKNKIWEEHAAAVAAAFAKELLGYVQSDEVDRERSAKEVISHVDDLDRRFYAEDTVGIAPIPEVMGNFRDSLTIEVRASEDDIRKYLNGRMSQLPRFVDERPDLQDEISSSIVKAVDGMALRKALQNLVTGSNAYDTAYNGAMERIESQLPDQKERAKQVLSWITFAERPLTKWELQHALAVEINEPELDKENLPQIEDMISICAGLVTVDEESSIIRLVHYTTQEYFDRTHDRWFPDARLNITTTCSTYLSFSAFTNGYCKTDEEFEQRFKSHLLYDYAARNWGHHARAISPCQCYLRFLQKPAEVKASSQALMVTGYRYRGYSQDVPKEMNALHLAAYFGLHKAVKSLIRECNTDMKDSHGRTPLSWAAWNGHEAVVKLLLGTENVDPNSKDDIWGQTPLLWAAQNGHEAVVKLLLATEKVDPDSKNNRGQTPLSWAARNGHETVVKLLLATEKVDPDSKDDFRGQTPLSGAAENGHEAVVKLLLATEKVDPDSKDNNGHTPLFGAARNGHEAVVKLLLGTEKVDPDSKDNNGQTPLLWVARNGHETVVKLLLATEKVDPDSKDDFWGQTPLSGAAENGHEAVVKLLLTTKKVDPDSKDYKSQTPLWWAAKNGHKAVMRALVEGGADINAADIVGVTVA